MKNDFKYFQCLKGQDVITAKISDHHPIIHNGVLFWNVMMQANIRRNKEHKSIGYNNAFALIEDQQSYHLRLVKIAHVIAEIIFFCSSIEVITLCEGPKLADVHILLNSFKNFSYMHKFLNSSQLHKPHIKNALDWGLLMLANENYKVKKISSNFPQSSTIAEQLANRFQLWKLSRTNKKKYICLAHFPFSKDEHVKNPEKISPLGKVYIYWINHLLKKYSNKMLTLCADFNLNPWLIGNYQDRLGDCIPVNNSALLVTDEKKIFSAETVTVDGILLSHQQKQKYFSSKTSPNLFRRLVLEHKMFQTHLISSIVDTLTRTRIGPRLSKGFS